MNPRFIILCCIFAVVFGFSLYLLACTASIYPDYQPDIGRIRWFDPTVVLTSFFIAAWFLSQRQTELRVFFLLALSECAAVSVIVLVADLSDTTVSSLRPSERTLWNTISFSLVHPQFSNRSYASPFYSAILIGILWLFCRNRSREK
jgi:multisubunit Na+/H+ antiporter MnhC subunit